MRLIALIMLGLVTGIAHAQVTTDTQAPTDAEPLWRGGFETGDLTEWHYLANPKGISVTRECAYEGDYAARIEIDGSDEFLWHGNAALNRSELNMKPADTSEGANVYFGWSYYLPRPLSLAKHELGYWESSDSWLQQMRFNIHGEALSFQASNASEVYWTLPEGAAAGRWHDLAMHIRFSSDPERGYVEIWHNGERVSGFAMQTRVNDTDAMFTQIGLLRHREDSQETILIDNARQASSLAGVLAGFDPQVVVTCEI